jgi:hypothetical protein
MLSEVRWVVAIALSLVLVGALAESWSWEGGSCWPWCSLGTAPDSQHE